MVISSGLIDWATQYPGPANKVYDYTNSNQGICLHSMEGWYSGSIAELEKPDRQASWMFSLRLDGELVQHYPITACPWASGNFRANTTLWSVELEGIAGTLANEQQVETLIALCEEFSAYTGLPTTRDLGARTLWEHNEVWDWAVPNAGSTSCPSGRYQTLYDALEEYDMTPEERELLKSIAQVLTGTSDPITAKSLIDQQNVMGMAFLKGYGVMWNNLWRHMNADTQAHPNGMMSPWSDM